MKYVLVIGDGMADAPVAALGGKTPLEALSLTAMDALAGCEMGLARTVPEGVPPGSDTAILDIFSYDPRTFFTGRSVLEAAGMGVFLARGELSFRVNLCAVSEADGAPVIVSHNGGGVSGPCVGELWDALMADAPFRALCDKWRFRVTRTDTFRHAAVIDAPFFTHVGADGGAPDVIFTEPHNVLGQKVADHLPRAHADDPAARALADDVAAMMLRSLDVLRDHPANRARAAAGLLPANMIWPWGPGTAAKLPSFAEKFGKTGSVVSAVPLVWGIAGLAGLKTPRVTGATGELHTDYAGKIDAAIAALEAGDDFAAIHVEAPDEMTHAGSLALKLQAITLLDALLLAPLTERLRALGDFRLLLLSDHLTLLSTRTHDGTPVPYALYDSRGGAGDAPPPRKFCERTCAEMGAGVVRGDTLMARLFGA